MIEDLVVRKELWTPVDLTGKETGEVKERLVCAYFPPHTAFSIELLKSADKKVLKVDKTTIPTLETSEGIFSPIDQLEITCSNGGALYLLGGEVDGIREAWLWKLTPGSESNDSGAG